MTGAPEPIAVSEAVAYHHAVLGFAPNQVERFLKLLFAMDEVYLLWQVECSKKQAEQRERDGH